MFDAEAFPVFLYECEDGSLLYGVPSGVSTERGVKIGFHNRQQLPSSPDESVPPVDRALKEQISERVGEILPMLRHDPIRAKWCFYTMSTDESFVMGKSERHVNVFYASVCSGHGFKFAPAIGEAMSCLAKGEKPPVDISQFSLQRFQ
jgi:sarcosine oxidase